MSCTKGRLASFLLQTHLRAVQETEAAYAGIAPPACHIIQHMKQAELVTKLRCMSLTHRVSNAPRPERDVQRNALAATCQTILVKNIWQTNVAPAQAGEDYMTWVGQCMTWLSQNLPRACNSVPNFCLKLLLWPRDAVTNVLHPYITAAAGLPSTTEAARRPRTKSSKVLGVSMESPQGGHLQLAICM